MTRASRGEIREVGYQRYRGARRSPSTRWLVIAREQLGFAWKTWWRYKAALAIGIMITSALAGLLYFLSSSVFLGMAGMRAGDAALPLSIEWYCRVGFYLSLVLGAGTVAGDVQTGAFTLYFARSIRPRDYVLGKLAGYALLVGSIVIAGPVLIALVRSGASPSGDLALARLRLVPRAVLVGAVVTIAYTTVPLGFSALASERRHAIALWAAYYLLIGTIAALIGRFSGSPVGAIDLPTSSLAVAFALFDVRPTYRRAARAVHLKVALLAIAAHAIVAVLVLSLRVLRVHQRGIELS